MRLSGFFLFLSVVRLLAVGCFSAGVLLASSSLGQVAQENAADPSALFLKAFTAVQQGEKLETDGRLKPALAKYRFAASVLEQIGQNNPNWEPLIVRYRLRKTADNIHQLEQKIYLQPANTGGPVVVSGDTANGEEQADLPRADDPLPGTGEPPPPPQRAPALSVTPVPAAPEAMPPPREPSKEAIDKATTDLRNRLEKSQKDLKTAQDQLNAAQKEKQSALKEKNNIEFQLESTRSEAKAAQKKVERARASRQEAEGDLEQAQKRLKDALAKGAEPEESRKGLRGQIARLKQAVAKAEADAQAAAKEKEALTTKLTESESRTAALTKERETLTANGSPVDAAKTIETLQAQNAELTQKLVTAETHIAELNAETAKRNTEVEGMQKELGAMRDQLAASRDQNDRNATTITDLKTQLDASSESLKKLAETGKTGEDFARLNRENELLRGIVMRQLKDQARRVAAKKLVTDELARLEVQSKTLSDQVAVLGQQSQPLSDEERALFKEPQITISDTSDPSLLATSIAAFKPRTPTDAGASPAPDGTASVPGVGTSPEVSVTGPEPTPPPKPKVAEALVSMATEAKDSFEHGKYPEAEKLYEKLLAKEPKNPYLLANQGVVLFRQDKLKPAEVMLKKAAAIAPEDAFSQSILGIIYYKMRRYDDAIDSLTKSIRIDPKNATAHNYLGITSSQKGWPEAALDEMQKAISLNPNYADAHFNIAVMYATNQPPAKDQAMEHYRKATELGATPDANLEKLIR